MKRTWMWVIGGPAILTAYALAHGEPSTSSEAFALPNDGCVVFLGDVLVERGTFPELVESFVRIAYPENQTRFFQLGGVSATPQSIAQVFDEDVWGLDPIPTHVVVCVGLNIAHMRSIEDEELARFRVEMETMVTKIKNRGVQITLLTPPSADLNRNVRLKSLDYNKATVGRIAETIRKVASTQSVGLVDWYGESLKQREVRRTRDPNFSFSRDGLRPQTEGNALVSALLLQSWGAQPLRDSISLDWKNGTATSETGRVAAEKISDTEVRLRLDGFPLPWAMPRVRGETQSPDWYAMGWCEYTIRVEGLPDGALQVSAEGGSSRISKESLEAGYNLALNPALTDAPETVRLNQLISTKNRLFTTRWIDQIAKKPADPELNEAFATLLKAYDLYHAGYVEIIDKTPRTLTAELTLRCDPPRGGRSETPVRSR